MRALNLLTSDTFREDVVSGDIGAWIAAGEHPSELYHRTQAVTQ